MSEPKKIRSWSFSRLSDFEACPLKAKLKIIDKIPEPERELPPGKTERWTARISFSNRSTRLSIPASCACATGAAVSAIIAAPIKDPCNFLICRAAPTS